MLLESPEDKLYTRAPYQFVPIRVDFGGESIDEFLHQFPAVKREFAIAVLDAAYETVTADANIA